jgi:crotonobetainyl-CoA:carnitine CoA-transferase CaiB-like acyl-CoA transferase
MSTDACHIAMRHLHDTMRELSRMDERRPLSGQTILELARPGGSEVTARAVALAGRIAADFGATVIKAEPADGDALRRTGPFIAGADGRPESATFVFLNGGKRSLRLPEGSQGRSLLTALSGQMSAVLTDDREALGSVLGSVPVRVMVEHGAPAAMPDARVSDTTVLAASGILDLVGRPDAAPVALGGHQASYVAGLAAFSGLAAALAGRDLGADSETITVSATEACLWANWKSFAEKLYLGRGPTREGRLAEWQAFPCTDGHAVLVYLDRDWPLVVRLIGDERLARPDLQTREGRRANMAEISKIVQPWFAVRSRKEVFALAKAAGLPIAPVIGVHELLADAQYAAQRFFARPSSSNCGELWQVPTVPTVWNGRRFAPVATQDGDAPGAAI